MSAHVTLISLSVNISRRVSSDFEQLVWTLSQPHSGHRRCYHESVLSVYAFLRQYRDRQFFRESLQTIDNGYDIDSRSKSLVRQSKTAGFAQHSLISASECWRLSWRCRRIGDERLLRSREQQCPSEVLLGGSWLQSSQYVPQMLS